MNALEPSSFSDASQKRAVEAPPRRGATESARVMIIGYGNVLRGDDGAGVHVAEAVRAWQRPDAQVHAAHQLTPELAEPLARARLAVFVDARLAAEGAKVEVQPLTPAAGSTGFGHTSDPRFLLALAQALYGRHPSAWLVTVPGTAFDAGEQLSPTAARGLHDAVCMIVQLCEYA